MHIQRCPQLQNKTCWGLVRHITQSPVLNVWIELISFLFKLVLTPILNSTLTLKGTKGTLRILHFSYLSTSWFKYDK